MSKLIYVLSNYELVSETRSEHLLTSVLAKPENNSSTSNN